MWLCTWGFLVNPIIPEVLLKWPCFCIKYVTPNHTSYFMTNIPRGSRLMTNRDSSKLLPKLNKLSLCLNRTEWHPKTCDSIHWRPPSIQFRQLAFLRAGALPWLLQGVLLGNRSVIIREKSYLSQQLSISMENIYILAKNIQFDGVFSHFHGKLSYFSEK